MVFEEDVEEDEQIEDGFYDDHLISLKEVGGNCLCKFFSDKQMHYGGRVSHAMLKSDRVTKTILETSVTDGVDRAYLSLSLAGFGRKRSRNGIREDTQLILDILNECSDLRIPKCFRGGILLLYIEFCHGFKVY